MALRGIQEYIARDVDNIARVEDEGNIVSIEPSNIIIIIHTGLCVSSYYLTIMGDCRLSLSCDDKMAAGSHPRSLDSKMTHKALYE